MAAPPTEISSSRKGGEGDEKRKRQSSLRKPGSCLHSSRQRARESLSEALWGGDLESKQPWRRQLRQAAAAVLLPTIGKKESADPPPLSARSIRTFLLSEKHFPSKGRKGGGGGGGGGGKARGGGGRGDMSGNFSFPSSSSSSSAQNLCAVSCWDFSLIPIRRCTFFCSFF